MAILINFLHIVRGEGGAAYAISVDGNLYAGAAYWTSPPPSSLCLRAPSLQPPVSLRDKTSQKKFSIKTKTSPSKKKQQNNKQITKFQPIKTSTQKTALRLRHCNHLSLSGTKCKETARKINKQKQPQENQNKKQPPPPKKKHHNKQNNPQK